MGRGDEETIKLQEYELWEAARSLNYPVFYKYLAPEVNVICNNFRCCGEEYVMMLPAFGLQRYSIEHYETVVAGKDQIQNYYLVNLKIAGSAEIKTCHVTSTWKRMSVGWGIVFHMRTLFI